MRRSVVLVVIVAGALAAAGCHREGCVGGDDGVCVPVTACASLRYVCAASAESLSITRIDGPGQRSRGPKALGAVGDFVLQNDRVRAVIDTPEPRQLPRLPGGPGLPPTGGTILDLAPVDAVSAVAPTDAASATGDQVNGISQAAGLLPRDAIHCETFEGI